MKKNKKTVLTQVKSHTKIVASLLAGYGVSQIMANVMKDYQPDAKGLKKMLIKLGAVALTGMVVKEVGKYLDSEIDELFDFAENIDIENEEENDEVKREG